MYVCAWCGLQTALFVCTALGLPQARYEITGKQAGNVGSGATGGTPINPVNSTTLHQTFQRSDVSALNIVVFTKPTEQYHVFDIAHLLASNIAETWTGGPRSVVREQFLRDPITRAFTRIDMIPGQVYALREFALLLRQIFWIMYMRGGGDGRPFALEMWVWTIFIRDQSPEHPIGFLSFHNLPQWPPHSVNGSASSDSKTLHRENGNVSTDDKTSFQANTTSNVENSAFNTSVASTNPDNPFRWPTVMLHRFQGSEYNLFPKMIAKCIAHMLMKDIWTVEPSSNIPPVGSSYSVSENLGHTFTNLNVVMLKDNEPGFLGISHYLIDEALRMLLVDNYLKNNPTETSWRAYVVNPDGEVSETPFIELLLYANIVGNNDSLNDLGFNATSPVSETFS